MVMPDDFPVNICVVLCDGTEAWARFSPTLNEICTSEGDWDVLAYCKYAKITVDGKPASAKFTRFVRKSALHFFEVKESEEV